MLNVVTGHGAVVGEAVGLSMDVDVLAFTRSGGTGRRLLEYSASSNLKPMNPPPLLRCEIIFWQ